MTPTTIIQQNAHMVFITYIWKNQHPVDHSGWRYAYEGAESVATWLLEAEDRLNESGGIVKKVLINAVSMTAEEFARIEGKLTDI